VSSFVYEQLGPASAMPVDPPVITATLPSSFPIDHSFELMGIRIPSTSAR